MLQQGEPAHVFSTTVHHIHDYCFDGRVGLLPSPGMLSPCLPARLRPGAVLLPDPLLLPGAMLLPLNLRRHHGREYSASLRDATAAETRVTWDAAVTGSDLIDDCR